MGRTAAVGNNNQTVKVATTLAVATPLLMGEKAIARLYFPVGSLCLSIAPWASQTEDGVYTPCLNPLVEPAVALSHSFTPATNGANIPIAPQCYDCVFIKFIATFSSGTSEIVPFTMKD
jgi:hypothetical protein